MSSSPPQRYLAIARVGSAHGVSGEVSCQLLTDFPERFSRTKRVFLGEEHQPIEIQHSRLNGNRLLLRFSGVENRTEAIRLVGRTVYIPESEAVRLPAGSYFWHQVIGMAVRTADGQDLGNVVNILETGSNDVYVVQGDRGEVLIPATKEVVKSIEVDDGIMTVELIEGLL
ncbi:MAG: 16S rRNA processing protein RimM [Chloroflexi bacterium]|nr:16S rRNA processing protein RimM [Chloroflexota bacterium]